MNSQSDLSSEEIECHAKFLVSATQYINSLSSKVLKSHMNILCHDTLRMKNFQFLRKGHKKTFCQYCKVPWKNGEFSYKILPTGKKGKRVKKIIKKVKNNQKLEIIEKKSVRAGIGNSILLKCLVCQNVVRFKVKEGMLYTKAGVKTMLFEFLFEKKGIKSGHKIGELSESKETLLVQPKEEHNDCDGTCDETDDIKITYENITPAAKRKPEQPNDSQQMEQTRKNKKKKKKNKNKNKNVPKLTKKKLIQSGKVQPFTVPVIGAPVTPYSPLPGNFYNYGAPNYYPWNAAALAVAQQNILMGGYNGGIQPNNDFGRNMLFNQFANNTQETRAVPKKKKLSKWKNLIAEEENKATTSHSLSDFIKKL